MPDYGDKIKVIITCPQCGFARNLADNKIPPASVIAKCPKCGCRFRFSREEGPGAILPADSRKEEPSDADIRETARQAYETEAHRFDNEDEPKDAWKKDALPWDSAPAPDGWLAAFARTVIAVMLRPRTFFQHLASNADWKRPASFFAIIILFQTVVERLWMQVIFSGMSSMAQEDPQMEKLLTVLMPEGDFLILTAVRLLSLVIQLLVFSVLMYLAYRLVARERASWRLVFDVMCYSTAPWLLCVVPGIGSAAGTLWSLWCLAAGCKTVMTLSWPETIIGFLPILIIMVPLLGQMAALPG